MKDVVVSEKAPQAIGPYSQASCDGNLIFVSGQLPLNPATGSIETEDVKEQTRQSLENICSILSAAGSDMDNILKTTVFLDDMADFGKMNEIYGSFFSEGKYPARSAVEVAALPKGAKVEIEAIALKK